GRDWAADRRRPARQAARDRPDGRPLLRQAVVRALPARRDRLADGGDRRGERGRAAGAQALGAEGRPGGADRRRRRHHRRRGGLSQTAVNDEARTQLAGGITGVLAVLTLLFLAGLFADLPQATLGALVVVSAMGLVQIEPLRAYGRIRRPGFWYGAITLVAV